MIRGVTKTARGRFAVFTLPSQRTDAGGALAGRSTRSRRCLRRDAVGNGHAPARGDRAVDSGAAHCYGVYGDMDPRSAGSLTTSSSSSSPASCWRTRSRSTTSTAASRCGSWPSWAFAPSPHRRCHDIHCGTVDVGLEHGDGSHADTDVGVLSRCRPRASRRSVSRPRSGVLVRPRPVAPVRGRVYRLQIGMLLGTAYAPVSAVLGR